MLNALVYAFLNCFSIIVTVGKWCEMISGEFGNPH